MALGQRLDRGTEKLVGLVADILELLTGNVLRRLVGIDRQLGLVEQPRAPRATRRRPLGDDDKDEPPRKR